MNEDLKKAFEEHLFRLPSDRPSIIFHNEWHQFILTCGYIETTGASGVKSYIDKLNNSFILDAEYAPIMVSNKNPKSISDSFVEYVNRDVSNAIESINEKISNIKEELDNTEE